MQVEFSKELETTLKNFEEVIQIQGSFLSDDEIMDRYLKRGFGNAYVFDQQDRIAETI